jgi:hypothetical protein
MKNNYFILTGKGYTGRTMTAQKVVNAKIAIAQHFSMGCQKSDYWSTREKNVD